MKLAVHNKNMVCNYVNMGTIIKVYRDFTDKPTDKPHYYLVVYNGNDNRYYLADIEDGMLFFSKFNCCKQISEWIKDNNGEVYYSQKIKLILG